VKPYRPPILKSAGIRVFVDKRDNLRPVSKFNDWENARRAAPDGDRAKGHREKQCRPRAARSAWQRGEIVRRAGGIVATVRALLDVIGELTAAGHRLRDSHLSRDHEQLRDFIDRDQPGRMGAVMVLWRRKRARKQVKADTSAASRNFPLDQPHPGETGPLASSAVNPRARWRILRRRISKLSAFSSQRLADPTPRSTSVILGEEDGGWEPTRASVKTILLIE